MNWNQESKRGKCNDASLVYKIYMKCKEKKEWTCSIFDEWSHLVEITSWIPTQSSFMVESLSKLSNECVQGWDNDLDPSLSIPRYKNA